MAIFCHPPSSTFFSKGSCLMLWKNMVEGIASDTDAQAEEEQELEALVESLDKTCTRYKMEISAEKTRLMTNSANGILREIKGRIWVLYKLHVPQSSCLR